MSLFGRRDKRAFQGMTAEDYIRRVGVSPTNSRAAVTNDTALRHSAVWACLRLRANLISTMPVDVYRKVNGHRVEVPPPPVLVNPGGQRVKIKEWLYSSQVDLDRAGNAIGLITETHPSGLPARIDLQPISECSIVPLKDDPRAPDGWRFRICGKPYYPDQVWHEKQYTISGFPMGLSPVAYAAWTIGEYLSIQDFALDFFGNSGVPAMHLKNTAKTFGSDKAQEIKDRFTASVQQGGLFVSGNDWELNLLQSEAAANSWLDAKASSVSDIARFFDCPGDIIDAAVQTGNITYASITQRNLQLLIMHIGPAVLRREDNLSDLTAKPRYVKLNSDALLRMDPQARAAMFKTQLDSRTRAPSELRALDELPPFTAEQIAELDHFFPPRQTPTQTTSG